MEKQLTVSDFEKELQKIFSERRAGSRSYSVRAMASEFKVPATTLQKVMRGERRLGIRVATELAKKLGIEIVPEKRARRTGASKWSFQTLNPDSKAQVSWINLAILEMIHLDDFEPNAEWVARKLGLPAHVVEDLLVQMESEQMLKRDGPEWTDLLSEASVHAERLLTSDVIRAELKKIMAISAQAIENIPYERREHSFSIFPVAESHLPQLKKKIVELRREFMSMAEKKKAPKHSIYAFQLGFFPLTSEESEK